MIRVSSMNEIGCMASSPEESEKILISHQASRATTKIVNDADDDNSTQGTTTMDTMENGLLSSDFSYSSIPSFDNFLDLCRDVHYTRIPLDWWVLVADIQGSTACIEQGRYRDVNTVGAMSIAAVRNALCAKKDDDKDDFPYCFGGDGASMVVRDDQRERAITALLALQRLVQANYKLHLRVGCVSIYTLEKRGASVEVARYEIVSGMSIALFRGGGLAMADAIVKHEGGASEQNEESLRMTPNLDGISCRWQKIPNKHGCVLTLLVMCNPDLPNESEIYEMVLYHLEETINQGSTKEANPVYPELSTYRSALSMARDEIRMHESAFTLAWIARFAEILLCYILFYCRILQHAIFDAPAYLQSIRRHADHRKFDDMLRMVLDCSNDQADSIEAYLKSLHDDKRKIFYGTQRSKHTLMTCLLKDTSEGNHIHFVDGDSGGYALAAKQLKMQLGTYTLSQAGK
jgi:hypothetical protein